MQSCNNNWPQYGVVSKQDLQPLRSSRSQGQNLALSSLRSLGFASCLLFCLGILLNSPVPLLAATRSARQRVVPSYSRFEEVFVSTFSYSNALQEANLTTVFTSPVGETRVVEGFWDGGRTWRVRFCPDMPGQWTFTTICSDRNNWSLDGQTGKFLCTAPVGEVGFQQHGAVRVASDRRHFEHADGTPFFWVADTVWDGARLANTKDWQRYAEIRSSQNFNVALWSVSPEENRDKALTGFSDRIGINPSFFQLLDQKIDTLAQEGILSAILPFSQPGTHAKSALPADQAALYLRYLLARWGAYPVAWLVDVSGDSLATRIARWEKIGNAVFTNSFHAPVIVLPTADPSAARQLYQQPWISAVGIDASEPRIEPRGSVASDLANLRLPQPIILFGPQENGLAGNSQKRFGPGQVRRSFYQNMLAVSCAGIVYAAYGVTDWDTSNELGSGAGANMPFWERALFMPGAKQIRPLATLMSSIEYWRLTPHPEAVPTQRTQSLPNKGHVVAASTGTKDLTLVYVPQPSGPVDLYVNAMPPAPLISWLEPQQGYTRSAVAVVSGAICQFPPPGEGDWVLLIKSGK